MSMTFGRKAGTRGPLVWGALHLKGPHIPDPMLGPLPCKSPHIPDPMLGPLPCKALGNPITGP